MNRQNKEHMPRKVAKRILERGARGEDAVVLTFRNGVPSRVFGLEEYLKMRELPKRVKPWEHREKPDDVPDPLGAVDLGKPLLPITREYMYDEED